MKVGVLALQGAFREHINSLNKLNTENLEVKTNSDLDKIDALIIPGGESTTISKLIDEFNMKEKLMKKITSGMPTWGTCAGMILLAKEIENSKSHLGVMNIKVKRNAYGRQLGSFSTSGNFDNLSNIPMIFIRAPYIKEIGNNVKILSKVDNKIVAAREKNILVTSFHPELTDNTDILKYFLNIIKTYKKGPVI